MATRRKRRVKTKRRTKKRKTKRVSVSSKTKSKRKVKRRRRVESWKTPALLKALIAEEKKRNALLGPNPYRYNPSTRTIEPIRTGKSVRINGVWY